VQIMCLERRFHPIRTYLSSVAWDGESRLETWLIEYFGAEDTPLNRTVGKLMLVAAVRRVRQPGVKFDTMVVLEGIQGSGKSTAISTLAGEGNFSDQNLFTLDDKAQMEAFEGVWLYEIAELDGMSHADVSKTKALISRTEDRGRPAYARFKESWPRQCILIGTTNDQFYLKDTTGNRRFLPVKTGKIELQKIQDDRDLLWAEAAKLEVERFPIELPEHLWSDAGAAQNARMQEDPWLDILANAKGVFRGGFERISTETLFGTEYLNILPAQRQSYHPKRIHTAPRARRWRSR
jgi:predicted P-loop ATPase